MRCCRRGHVLLGRLAMSYTTMALVSLLALVVGGSDLFIVCVILMLIYASC